MKQSFLQSVVLLITFTVAFLVTTILTDSLDKHNGYYDEGIRASQQVGK